MEIIYSLRKNTILTVNSSYLLKFIKLTVLIVFILSNAIGTTHAVEIRISKTSELDTGGSYEEGLLRLLLTKISEKNKLTKSATIYTQARAIQVLSESTKHINLYAAGTSSALEKKLLPIYFPIYRGLLGYRLLITNKNDNDKFSHIKTLSDLQEMQGAQAIGWADKALLEHSGLQQYSAKYGDIFSMIDKGRVDYFSRGVMEAKNEVARRKHTLPNLSIDENILLHYPFAMYFFTHKDNKQLAELLTQAFNKAYEDGSFLDYFNNHPETKDALKQLALGDRVTIEIPNPFLTQETMNIPLKYWHQALPH